MSASIQVGQIRFDTTGARPAPNTLPGGSFFYDQTTNSLYLNATEAAGQVWRAISGSSAAGAFIVGPAGSGAQFTSIQSAIDAAVAAGYGPANPTNILILPGTYTENPIARVGINLSAANHTTPSSATAPSSNVVVNGSITVADEAGSITIYGLLVNAATGVPITLGGLKAVTLSLTSVSLSAQDAVSPALWITNSHASSAISIVGSRLANAAPAAAALQTSAATAGIEISCQESQIIGDRSVDHQGVNVSTFRDCAIGGVVTGIAGNSITINGGSVDTALIPTLDGGAAYILSGFIGSPNGITFAPTATMAPSHVTNLLTTGALGGAGPHTLTATSPNIITVTPPADGVVVVNLPSVLSLPDGAMQRLVVGGSALGSAVVVPTAAAGEGIGTGGGDWYRAYEGGTVALRSNRAGLRWDVEAESRGVPQKLDVYADAATGSDNNPGTPLRPTLTLDAEFAIVARQTGAGRGWASWCHMNAAAGTYTLAASAIVVPPASSGIGPEPPVLVGAMADSGLGARTVAGSSAGAGATFATVTDTAGGLVVNAWKGYFLRYTSGAQAGKQYLIDANTANVFTLVGTQSVPVNGDTYVVESPATIVRTANNILLVNGTDNSILGARQVQFDGQSGATSDLSIRQGTLIHSACWFKNWFAVTSEPTGAVLTEQFSASATQRIYFPSLGIPQTIGSYFVSGVANASLNTTRFSTLDLQQSMFDGVSIQAINNGRVNISACAFQGASGVRSTANGTITLSGTRFEAVSGLVGDYATAAIVGDSGARVTVSTTDVSNCVGIALSLSGSAVGRIQTLVGSGNAGVPVSILRTASLIKSSGNTVTGAVAGNDVQIGGNAAPNTWASVNGGLNTDQAAVASQFCTASN